MGALRDQTLALAGVFQAARLVQQVARRGMAEASPLETTVRSIFVREAQTAEAVYGGPAGVHLGLRTLCSQLGGGPGERDLELTRYVVAILQQEQRMRRRRTLLSHIAERLDQADTQARFFEVTHRNVMANLAGIYSETVGTLRAKIMVYGDQDHLGNADNVNRVRAVLLAGLRAAVLWRQRGGSRLGLLWHRRQILEEARELAREAVA